MPWFLSLLAFAFPPLPLSPARAAARSRRAPTRVHTRAVFLQDGVTDVLVCGIGH